jgi:hypothetical protein
MIKFLNWDTFTEAFKNESNQEKQEVVIAL